MELRHLRYFIAVAEHLNFSRAADALQTAQPSLSHQIRELEAELKVTLFERTHRYVTLTAEGTLLLPEARAIVERADALSTLQDSASVPRGPLRIASITVSTIGILPKVLPSYRENFPNVELSVETWPPEEGVRALLERRVDVAFVRRPLDDPRLDSVIVAEEQLCVALPSGHPLSSSPEVSLQQLNGFDLVGLHDEITGDFNSIIDGLFKEHGVVPRSTVRTGTIETMQGLVAAGMGLAVCSAALKIMLLDGVELRPLAPYNALKNLCLAWRSDRAALPTIRSFRDNVVAAAISFFATTRH
jgi:DNA-binding transcriptional LysR family regulator